MTTPDPYALALQDPEYLALLAQLQAALNNQQAEFDARGVAVRTRYGRQLREAGQALPNDLRRSTEQAAGRGMLYSGGLLEEQGDIQKRFADYNAQIGEDQTAELAQIIRGQNAAKNDFEAQKGAGLQGAIGRALARAQAAPISNAGGNNGNTPGAGTPAAAAPPVATPAPATPAPAAPVPGLPDPLGLPTGPQTGNFPVGQSNPEVATGPSSPSGFDPLGRRTAENSPNTTSISPTAGAVRTPTVGSSMSQVGYQPNAGGETTFNQPVARDTSRSMSSFDQASQTKLSLGQVVVAGDGRRMKYDPLTGRVVAV